MNNKIIITSEDILGWDGTDPTEAFKELGVDFIPLDHGYDEKIADLTFEVDLDFVLRHNLMNSVIYDDYYKNSELYQKYYEEGKRAFYNGQKDNPYIDSKQYYIDSYPWFDGYQETEKWYYTEQYNLDEFDKEFKELAAKYNLIIQDEYGYVYLKTKEGYIHNL